MRSHLPTAVAIALVWAARSLALYAATDPKHLEPGAPRSINVTEAMTPPVVRAGLLESTIILLPAEEKVVNVFAGDTVDWVFDGGHVPSRFLSVKPKIANCSTDLHIISDHGNEYTLELEEVSNDTDLHFDSKVFIVPIDKVDSDRLAELPVFVPASELDAVKKDAATARDAAAAALKAEKAQEESYRSQYPSTLRFDYSWDKAKGKTLGLEQIWRDDKFTYLRGQFQETPALYEVKDKRPSLINFDFSRGLYTVPKELDYGYLAIGKQKVDFHRSEETR